MAINLSNVCFTLEQVLGSENNLAVLGVSDNYEFVNGKKTNNRIGSKYDIIQTSGDFTRFFVKIPDNVPLITVEQIQASKKPIFIALSNARCTLYTDTQNHIQVSVKADGISILS